jgi:hypothetical protein
MSKILKFWLMVVTLGLIGVISACTSVTGIEDETSLDTVQDFVHSFEFDDSVKLTQSSLTWETYEYELTEYGTILPGSYDGETKVQTTFDTWILENKYLKVTLLPEFGGRILSIIYKPTGHEELYQNPVGVPYQIGTKIFYHDWLMVYGGIFPTFPEPEHGKAWFFPWDFEIIKESDQEVLVAMSFIDDSKNLFAPPQYNLGATGLKVTYYVSLKAGRAAIDTVVVIENPGDTTVKYEYWTNTTLAPGSDPADPKTTSGAEIIAPVDMIKIPSYWTGIAAQEKQLGFIDVYEFNNLRSFENWSDMGIAYAFPDMQDINFWGVINHDNQEGIFRIADNSITPGMKIWTWGYPQTISIDPYTASTEARPYIELWAGVTREFWQRTEISPNHQLEIKETYSPSVGLDDVTHANSNFLVNIEVEDTTSVNCQVFGIYPDQVVTASFLLDGVVVQEVQITLDPDDGNFFSITLPEQSRDGLLELVIEDDDGNILFTDSVSLAAEG